MSLYTVTAIQHGLQSYTRIFIRIKTKFSFGIPHQCIYKQPIKLKSFHDLKITNDSTMSKLTAPPLGAFVLSPLSKQIENPNSELPVDKNSFITDKNLCESPGSSDQKQTENNITVDGSEILNIHSTNTKNDGKVTLESHKKELAVSEKIYISQPGSLAAGLLNEQVLSEKQQTDIKNVNLMMKLRVTGPPIAKHSVLPVQLIQDVSDTIRRQYSDDMENKTESKQLSQSCTDKSDSKKSIIAAQEWDMLKHLDDQECSCGIVETESGDGIRDVLNHDSTLINSDMKSENVFGRETVQMCVNSSDTEMTNENNKCSINELIKEGNTEKCGHECIDVEFSQKSPNEELIANCNPSETSMQTDIDNWSCFPFAGVDLSENEKDDVMSSIPDYRDVPRRRAKKRKRKRKWRARKIRRTEFEQINEMDYSFKDATCSECQDTFVDQNMTDLNENEGTKVLEMNCDQENDKSCAGEFKSDEVVILADEESCLPFADMNVTEMIAEENDKEAQIEQPKQRKQRKKSKASKRARKDSITTENENDDKEKESDKKKPQAKPRPNYFISVQITNPQVHMAVEDVQSTVLSKNKDLQSAMIPVPTIHLTLKVMYLGNQEDIDRAKSALENCADRLKDKYDRKLVVMDITGIGHFRDETVFAKVSPGEPLDDLTHIAEEVEACFEENGVPSTDKKAFKPHITMMKMSKTHGKLRKKGIKKIDSYLYKEHINRNFGKQLFTGLQLCSMLKRKDPSGYYHVEHQVKIGPQKSNFSTFTSLQGNSVEDVSADIVSACVQCAIEKVYQEMPKPKTLTRNNTSNKKSSVKQKPCNPDVKAHKMEITTKKNTERKIEDDVIYKDVQPLIEFSKQIVHSCIESALKILHNKMKDDT